MPQDNRLLIAIGAGLAVVAAVVIALIFSAGREPNPAPPPAAQGGLTVDVADAPELNTTRELRCFVDGQYVGLATLSDCARRNGVATDALDVGIDATGALAAAPTAAFAPPPSAPPVALTEAELAPLPEQQQPTQPAVQPASGSACLRHTGSDWRSLSSNMSLNACVQALYSGTCVRPGEALYGRWGDVTLRLVPRRVEQSNDNSRFRTLAEQDRSCTFPGLR
jgi:integrase